MLEEKIDQDLKTALIGGDQVAVRTLRGLKSALLYVKVAQNKRDSGLSQTEEIDILQKEAKKRQESADLFRQGGRDDKAEDELAEKAIIEKYLPTQLSSDQLRELIRQPVEELQAVGLSDMGKVIGAVKTKAAGAADGSQIAALVKEVLSQ